MAKSRVAVAGSAGQLGRHLVRAFERAGDEVLRFARPDFDITRSTDLKRLAAWSPDLVINCAAWTDVDGCAQDPDRAMQVNGHAAGALAEVAAGAGALAVQISTNEVFDGEADEPYSEDDAPNPINPYGASKLLGERLVAAANPQHLIVRTAWLFDSERVTGFPAKIRRAAEAMSAARQPLRVVADEWGNPTSVSWLAGAIYRLVTSGPTFQVIHLAGIPPVTRLAWASAILAGSGVELTPISLREYSRPSRVPRRAVLAVERAASLGVAAFEWRANPH